MKTALFILTFVFVSLYVLGQETSDNNKPLFYDNDVIYISKCTKDYPCIPLSKLKGDTLFFFKTNFPAGSRFGHFGLTNRTIQALVDTMRKEIPLKTVQLFTNEYGISWVVFYIDTPEELKKKAQEGKLILSLEICIPFRTLRKREDIIKKYMAVEKLLGWDDKYLKVLGGITYEYAVYVESHSYN